MSKFLKLGLFVLIIIAAALAVGYFVFPKLLDNQTTHADKDVETAVADLTKALGVMTDRGHIAPWADQNPDNATVTLPSVASLDKLYREVRTAYFDRDYNKYKQYASPLRIWFLENNTQSEIKYKGLNAFSRIPGVPEDSFQTALLLCAYNAPVVDLLKPVDVIEDNSLPDSYDFYYFDNDKKEQYLVTNSKWEHAVVLNYQIKTNDYQNGTGKVYFVYYKGEWKYSFESWQNQFKANALVDDSRGNGKGSTFEINVSQPVVENGELHIKAGDTVLWSNFYGIIYTLKPSTKNWNSPLIADGSYKKDFSEKGQFTYTISDTFRTVYSGVIYVE